MYKEYIMDIKNKLKKEIEKAQTGKQLTEVGVRIAFRGRFFGLTDKDMDELREVFNKRLKEVK